MGAVGLSPEAPDERGAVQNGHLEIGNAKVRTIAGRPVQGFHPGQSGEAYKVLSQDRHHAVGYVCPSICTFVGE
jgi:hypothetical protein